MLESLTPKPETREEEEGEEEDESLSFVWEFMPQAPPEVDEKKVEEEAETETNQVRGKTDADKDKKKEEEEESRLKKEYLGHSSLYSFMSPDYDKLVKNNDVEAYLQYLPKWIQSEVLRISNHSISYMDVQWRFGNRQLPSNALDPGYVDLIREIGQILNDTIINNTNTWGNVGLSISLDEGYPLQILEHLLPTLNNATDLSLERPKRDRNRGFFRFYRMERHYGNPDTLQTFKRLAKTVQCLQSLQKLSWDLPDNNNNTETGDIICQAIMNLSMLRELALGGQCVMPSPEILQDLIQKDSLQILQINQNLPTKEHIMAMVSGLRNRNGQLEYRYIKFDPKLVSSSLDGILQEIKFILETCQVEPGCLSIGKDVCNITLQKQCSVDDGYHIMTEDSLVCVLQQQQQQEEEEEDQRNDNVSEFVQALVQKESLDRLTISYGIDNDEVLMAVTNGLQHRQQGGLPLKHLSLTVEKSIAISSMDAFLLDLGFTISTKKVESVSISVSNKDDNNNNSNNGHGTDDRIFHMPLTYTGGGRIPTLWVQPILGGVTLMPSWREWLPYMCFSLALTTIEILGLDGCRAGCDAAAGIAATIPVHDLEINLTEDYKTSTTAFMDLSRATRHLKRIGILKQQPDKGEFRCSCCGPTPKRVPIYLDGEVRFAFPSTVQELIFGGECGRKSINVSMEYITKALSSFPNINHFDNPSELTKVKAFLPDDYFETNDVAVRKALHRSYLDAAWKHCRLRELSVEGKKKCGERSYSLGAVHFLEDDDNKGFRDEVECMLKLNEAGRSYVYDPNMNHWWSGIYTLVSVQKLLVRRPELHPSAVYYLLREDPSLLDSRQRSQKQKQDATV